VRTCQPARQQASPDGDAAQRSATDSELVQRLTSELGMLLGDEEGDPDPLFSPEVRACAIVSVADIMVYCGCSGAAGVIVHCQAHLASILGCYGRPIS
jgi:hypothetical protein